MEREINSNLGKENIEIKSRQVKHEEEYDYITIPPDGGFGWIVLAACFLINFVIDGILCSFGAISKDLQEQFNCKEWSVSLIISLAIGFYMLSSPIAAALCNKWGCRSVGVVGSILASGCIAGSIGSLNVASMWFLCGILTGIGMNFLYLPSIVMVGCYFEERRSIARGIITAGTGISSIIFPPFLRVLFNAWGWKRGFFTLSGFLLCCGISCAFMRPLKPIRKRRALQFSATVWCCSIMNDVFACKIAPSDPECVRNQRKDKNILEVTMMTSPTKQRRFTSKESKVVSPTTMSSTVVVNESSFLENERDENAAIRSPATSRTSQNHRSRTESDTSNKSWSNIKPEDAVRPLYKGDVLYPGDTTVLPEFQSQPDLVTYIQKTTKVPETVVESKMKAFWDIFLATTNFHLLHDKTLIILCLANIFSMIGYYTPYVFIVKYALQQKTTTDHHAVALLSLIGASNTVCRFTSGWITKVPYFTPLLVNNIGLIVAGLATLLMPFCLSFISLAFCCIVWGGFIAFHVALSPIIICQLVGLELYSSALGLSLVFRGFTVLFGLALMGAICDITNSFTMVFVVSGFTFLASSLMYFYIMWISRSKNGNDDQPSKDTELKENPEISSV